ncbi:hypothetical protein Pst134EB_003907 [Puccinia striiformis f. sp. tritici]|nr:hypothetical protein Pst134EB_003907 [Puccinia striiformis f. sp. tritici]
MNISLLLIPFIIQYFATGMNSPRGELASLGRESSIDDRDGISQFPSPPRMVELLPVDRVSIDMPPYNDVSTYGTLIREHKSPYKLPPQEERAMNTYPAGRDARDHPASSDEVITRTRGDDKCSPCYVTGYVMVALGTGFLILLLVYIFGGMS